MKKILIMILICCIALSCAFLKHKTYYIDIKCDTVKTVIISNGNSRMTVENKDEIARILEKIKKFKLIRTNTNGLSSRPERVIRIELNDEDNILINTLGTELMITKVKYGDEGVTIVENGKTYLASSGFFESIYSFAQSVR